MISCVLFDVDDTLMDYHRAETEIIRRIFTECGKTANQAVLDDTWRMSWEYWDAERLSDTNLEEVQRDYHERYHRSVGAFCAAFSEKYGLGLDGSAAYARFNALMGEMATLYDDALPTLGALHSRCKIGVATNGLAAIQFSRLRSLQGCIDHIFCSEVMGVIKPMTAYFEQITQTMQTPPEQCLMVGDSLTSDIAGAAAAGMKTCWVNRAGGQPAGGPWPDYTVGSLSEVLKIEEIQGGDTQ